MLFVAFGVYFFGFLNGKVTVAERSAGGGLLAPTGVVASDNNYADRVGVLWDTVRGATSYRVFRNTVNDPTTATDVGTSTANYFFDSTALVAQPYYYWVRAENSMTVSEVSLPDQGTRAFGNIFPGPFPPLLPPPAPSGNPVTAAKASLGKALFWDEQLSSTRTVACGTCHQPAKGGSDPRTILDDMAARHPGFDGVFGNADDVFGSPGVPRNNMDGTYTDSPLFGANIQVTGRKSPSYLNSGYSPDGLFWDGRAPDFFRDPITNELLLEVHAALESQVLAPPLSDVEMGHIGRNWPQVAAQIAVSRPLALASKIPPSLRNWIDGRSYPELFEEAFGSPEVTPARIAMAIATHERQLFSDHTPLDKWAASIEPLTKQEQDGLDIFINVQCNVCHDGSLLADHVFHNIGVRPQFEDRGRGTVTNNPADDARFKTPTLRNVELHAPYMHNGRFATLEEVVQFYNRGGNHNAPNIDRALIRPLGLTPKEITDLVAFMKRPLTDPRVRDELPPFDRPMLYTESARVPEVFGTGRPGAGGDPPRAIALEPPIIGNPSFTVAVADAVPGATAVLVLTSEDPGIGTSIPPTGSFTRSTVTLSGSGSGSVSLAIPDNPVLVGRTFFGRWYVNDATAENGFSVSQLISFTVFGAASTNISAAHADFDGDRKTDISIYRTSLGQWWYLRSSDLDNRAFQFGDPLDKIVPADFTGDGKTDVAVWRPSNGTWYVLRSEDSSFYAFPFGSAGDIPLAGDVDGDGIADPVIFRPSTGTWYINRSTGGVDIRQFGGVGDIPQVGDFDGDGLADIGVFRPSGATGSEWWIDRSSAGLLAVQFGLPSDKPVIGDYTGDGRADIAFWRASEGAWYVIRSEDLSYFAVQFGSEGDLPAPGDYDGDGRSDFAVFRPSAGTWYLLQSTLGIGIVQFGQSGDSPVPAAYVP